MKIWLYLLVCFLCPAVWSATATVRDIGGTTVPVPLPDLTVTEVKGQPGWVSAHVREPQFLRLLDADLQDIALVTGAELSLNRTLPEINYAVVTCRSWFLLDQPDTDDGLVPMEQQLFPELVPPLEEIRQRLLALPYVASCVYNPRDVMEPQPLTGTAFSPKPAIGEIIPTELVLIFTGRPLPQLLLTAQVTATPADWSGFVTAETVLTRSVDGVVAGHFRSSLILRNGNGEFSRPVGLPPGDYTLTVTIDPDSRILESEEGNNVGALTVNTAVILMQLAISPPGRIESGAEVCGEITLANFQTAEFLLRRDQIQFELDSSPLTVSWPPLLAASAQDDMNPVGGVLLKPGSVIRLEFRFTAPAATGDHGLKAQLTEAEASAAAGFKVVCPQLGLNYRPVCDERIHDIVKVVPAGHDPTIAALLRNAALNAFAADPTFLEVQYIVMENAAGTGPVMANSGSSISPVAWDLFLVLRFLENSPSREKLGAFAQTLTSSWFVTDAQLLPVLATDLRLTADETVAVPGNVVFTSLNTFRIGVRLAHDAEPREMTRLIIPVLREEAAVTDFSMPIRPPPRFVAVTMVREAANSEIKAPSQFYQTWIHGSGPDRAPAAAYFPVSSLLLTCQVTVDPDNTVPESDESDNACSFQDQPALKPQFAARAYLEWDRIPAAGSLLPTLLLKVQGIMINPGPLPLELVFPSALQLDFTWESQYRWSTGKMFAQVVTRVEIPAGGEYTWEIQAPLAEVWQAMTRPGRFPGLPNLATVLTVELSGTDYRQKVPVKSVLMADSLDADGDLLPDDWEEGWLQTVSNLNMDNRHDGSADDDQDGWPNLLEFIYNTNPEDADSKPFGRLFTLDLIPGWNLVSLPVEPACSQVSDLFGELLKGPVWEWLSDPATGQTRYEMVENLAAGKAYWLYVTEPAEVPVAGTSPEPQSLRLGKGWNLIGTPEGNLRRDDPLEPTIWTWSALRQDYEAVTPDQELAEGQGYWVAARRACDLPVTGE